MPDRYVQYGCGHSAPTGWINFDSSPTLRFERLPLVGRLYTKNSTRFPGLVRYGDAVAGLPIESSSCAGVYASHVLEHLSLEDCRSALRETVRILRPGGRFRAVVPDLAIYAKRYLSGVESADSEASHRFMRESYLGTERRATSLLGRVAKVFGHSAHLWMWDIHSLSAAVREAGFSQVRSAELNDSADPTFRSVEDARRFLDACAVEAVK
jgi:predicted SAM-dependent methyltransferase